jgi:pimeloyl-ACP methyl ester carboxylesterase
MILRLIIASQGALTSGPLSFAMRCWGIPKCLIASRIPNARLAIIDDAGHTLVMEKPQEVTRLVREFLAASSLSQAAPATKATDG